MAQTKNKYGLSRDIGDPIKREIRQRSGFGCVICGSCMIDYEHVDPEFANARSHDPNKITLLCPMCHGKVTRNLISKSRVKLAMENPKCKQQGFSFEEFDPAMTHPFVKFAGVTLKNCNIPIEVNGLPLFLIEPPEESGAPYRLSATFCDQSGFPSLLIRRNEWRTSSSQWDVTLINGRITIRSGHRKISLQMLFVPAEGIIVEKVDMKLLNYHFLGNQETLTITQPNGGKISLSNCISDNCHIGLSLN